MFIEISLATDRVELNLAEGPTAGPPLLLLHGVARRWQDYAVFAPALAARWHVLALDFRGHGNSRRADQYRVVDYVHDALAVLHKRTSQPAVVYGHSLGAMVAAAVASQAPERVRAVVLEDPPFGTLGPEIRQTAFHSMFTAFSELAGSEHSVDELAAALANVTITTPGKPLRLRMSELRDPAALRFMASCLKRLDPAAMTPLVEGRWMEGYDQESILRGISCPALLLQGEYAQGGMLADAEAARVTQLLPRGLCIKVAGAGHLLHTMQPETTLRLVTAFLESLR